MAVVDTAAQDGLIGTSALERLKEQLEWHGLQIAWTGRQAKAHGIGGQAKVIGIAAIPLGIAGTSGVLEATVVEGEIPLLLPIKMLRHLRAVIDLSSGCVQFHELHKTVPLFILPSGHIAIEVCQFGPEGFSLQSHVDEQGMPHENEFRLDTGSRSTVMLSQFVQRDLSSPCAVASNVSLLRNGPVGWIPSSFEVSRRCAHEARRRGDPESQFKAGFEALASSDGQGGHNSNHGWIRGLGALVASSGSDPRRLFPNIWKAACRVNQRSRKVSLAEVEDGGTSAIRSRVQSPREQAAERRQPTWRMGDMHGLLREVESAPLAEEGHCESKEEGGRARATGADVLNCEVFNGDIQPHQVHEGDRGEVEGRDEEDGEVGGECCCGKVIEERAEREQEADRRVEVGSDAISTSYSDTCERDEGGKDVGERQQAKHEDAGDHDVRVRHHGDGPDIPRAEVLHGRRDVGMGGTEIEVGRGDGDVGPGSEGEPRIHGTAGGSGGFQHCSNTPSPQAVEVAEQWKKGAQPENWIGTKRLKREVEKIKEAGVFVVKEILVTEGGQRFVATEEELDTEDEGVFRVGWSEKKRLEEEIEEIEEIALPKAQKKRLRKAEQASCKEQEVLAVGVSEVFSPPRITKEARRQNVSAGGAYDLVTGYDLKLGKDLRKMWRELREEDPELVTGSPPCTPFSLLQSLNLPKMDEAKAVNMVGEGLQHVSTTVDVCKWQHRRGKLFLFEHPPCSKAFKEEEVIELMQMPGVHVCQVDMCQYGMNVDGRGPNQKPTIWITNSVHIARQLQRRCGGEHRHVALMGGLAKKAAEYPEELCRAIVKGLKQHLREKYGERREFEASGAVYVGEGEGEDKEQDSEESSSSESSSEDEAEVKKTLGRVKVLKELEDKEGRVRVSSAEKTKLRIMHVNLGHPSKASFIRFLRAGRVREELIRWVRSEFECATCQSNVLPKAPRPAVVPRGYAPGVAVGIDLFYVPDVMNQKSVPILNVVDLGTNYQMVEVLENKEPAHIWRTFWRVWARTFGLPQYVAIDEGREFRSHFSKLCASAGTIVFRAAARAPWQQGRVERHGALLKTMLEKSREEMVPTTPEELLHLLHACECAKNRFSNRSGYSPTQRQIGQWPRMPSSLLSDEEIDPSLQAQSCTDDFEKLMEMRRIAQNAFMKLNCSEAAVKALKARPRAQRFFKPGDVVYVFRALRKRKTIHGGAAVRGGGMGRKATWVGPGHVLAMEGSVVWINMLGELWRAAVEQVRMASSTEKLGSELIAEHCEEMQERLKRSAHRSGYRDISKEEWPEFEDSDEKAVEGEVEQEGEERGRPRVRFEEVGEGEVGDEYVPTTPEREESLSVQTLVEPEEETPVMEENILDEAVSELDEQRMRDMAQVVEANDRKDGVKRNYEAIRGQVSQHWRRRLEAPYFTEMEFFLGNTEETAEVEAKDPDRDYWVFDPCRNVLQRHHVVWRKALFNPAQAEESPIPMRGLKKRRVTRRLEGGVEEKINTDEWSLFSKGEEKFGWWKGITEFDVDPHFLQAATEAGGGAKKKRGEGEVFPHEIEKEEWPFWEEQDKEEFGKIVASGALRVLSVEESRKVKERLKRENKLSRILPSRMVRRYKPGDAPGAPRTRKSRFCIRGDRDPDAIHLTRFAPTVTTSNLQVLIQAAVNRKYRGVVGDLKSAFCQSMPLVRENGPIYCRSHHGSMPGLHEEQIAEVVLGCYGLMDAPLNWRKTLVQFVKEELNYKQSALDPCTFILHDDGRLRGLLAIEVDDLLMFGDEEHEKRMEKLQKRFTFGKLEEIGEEGVNFNGRRLRRKNGELLVDMKAFVEERLMTVDLDAERMKQRSDKISEEERSKVRSTCGALNWAGREGRPDAAAAASLFSSQMLEMTIQDVAELNRVVARLKKTSEMALRIQPIEEGRMRWGVISDASYANARNGKTQAGHMLIAFDEELLKGGQATTNLLHWKSGKLQRTVNSTLAAETQSLARGVGDLLWMMAMYYEMTEPGFQLLEWRKRIGQKGYTAFSKKQKDDRLQEALAVIDAKSLYDLLNNETTGGSDRRTALDIQVLREELHALQGRIRWIEHLHMPADCLTKKQGRTEPLLRLLEDGTFGITAAATALSDRRSEREQLGYNKR